MVSVVSVRAQRAAVSGPAERLRSLLDLPRLVSLGWDPDSRVWTVDPTQSVFSYRGCGVAGCGYKVSGKDGLCMGCLLRWRAGASSLEEFLSQPLTRERWRSERLCTVCRTPGHTRPAKLNGLCLYCEATRRRRKQTVDAYIAGDDHFPAAHARPTMGICVAAACGRLAAFRMGLCQGHHDWWRDAGRPEVAMWSATADPLLGDRGSRITLAGLPERFQLELLFGIQMGLDHGRKLRPSVLRTVIGWARKGDGDSFEALQAPGADAQCRQFIDQTIDAIALTTKTPELECTKDVWDLRVWGLAGSLYFVGGPAPRNPTKLPMDPIHQRWLRDAAKAWAASRLPLASTDTGVRSVVTAVGRWSAHLSGREGGGDDPTMLAKDDITSFLAALRVMVNQGRLHPYMHTRTVSCLRRFLREGRDLELDQRGKPLFGLARSVGVELREVPAAPKRDAGDEVGDAIPDAVLVQLLGDDNLALLSPDGRRRFEIGLEVGRRPGELCRLAYDCVAYDQRINEQTGEAELKPVLLHDMRKVHTVGCRLPIHEHTAELIGEQQAAVRARFPITPVAELVLFPGTQRDQGGRRPISTSRWASEMRTWVSQLELFEGSLDGNGSLHLLRGATDGPVRFDPARLFPQSLRHTYAQRHVNAGTPVEVLRELMGHDKLDTTSGYYRISAERKRNAVKRVMPLQVTVSGARLRLLDDPSPSDLGLYALSQVAVPMGSCVEPSNVRARGGACDFRYRCFGCTHFRTDPSYLPELRAYLTKLLATRERLAAAVPQLTDWARREAMPSDEEIDAVRRLVDTCDETLAQLDADDRGAIEEAIEVLRTGRAAMDTVFPVQFRGVVAQPTPVLFPTIAAQAGHLR
ncbi:MAG: tyrosine-type recombinase/integrase [Actinomycetota bacterium]|nr:tyrosine-type recombinase/integrase [Actinomycetota bacterium]